MIAHYSGDLFADTFAVRWMSRDGSCDGESKQIYNGYFQFGSGSQSLKLSKRVIIGGAEHYPTNIHGTIRKSIAIWILYSVIWLVYQIAGMLALGYPLVDDYAASVVEKAMKQKDLVSTIFRKIPESNFFSERY